jgi:predicted transcriptional regulator
LNIKPKDNDARNVILAHINRMPGTRTRELLRATGLTNGSLERYLKILERSKDVKVKREKSRMTRYFPRTFTNKECLVIGYMRRNTTRKILSFIIEHNNKCTFKQILEYINKAKSTTSWQLNRLKAVNIIYFDNHQYKLQSDVIKMLDIYKYTILENIPDISSSISDKIDLG